MLRCDAVGYNQVEGGIMCDILVKFTTAIARIKIQLTTVDFFKKRTDSEINLFPEVNSPYSTMYSFWFAEHVALTFSDTA